MNRSAARVASLGVTAVLACLGVAGVAAPLALAVPGVPDPPVALFSDDFENGMGIATVGIESYTSAPPFSVLYRPDAAWDPNQSECNGLVVSAGGNAAGCGSPGDESLDALALKVATMNGSESPDDNHVIGEHQDADETPVHGDLELGNGEPMQLLDAPGTFLVGGVDVAVSDCAAGAPLFSFVIADNTGATPIDHALSPSPQDACLQGADVGDGMRGGKIYSDASVLSNFTDLTLELHNTNTGPGSYHALDTFTVADATPQLDVEFGSASAPPGSSVPLTFTVTNTSELASKEGWSFSGDLPGLLTVVDGASVGFARATTCPSSTVTAQAGGQSFAVSGNLATDQMSCTITLNVTSPSGGTFTVDGSSFARLGLRLPGSASITFATVVSPPPPPRPPVVGPPLPGPGAPAACADGIDNDGDGLVDAKDPGCVLGGAYVPQKNSEANIAALAQCANGALQLTDVFGRDGRTVLRGVAGPDHVGKAVSLVATWGADVTVAKAVVKGDLSFATTAKLPPLDIRNTNAARYQARIGDRRSLNLKFSRRMTETVATRLGATRVKIGGRVTKPLADPRATVAVRAAPSCQTQDRFRGVVVARDVKVNSSGAWSATIKLPAAIRGDKVFLRGSTSVRKSTSSRKTFATYTLIQGVTLK